MVNLVSAVCLLDLSAAFNTVDHDLLMQRIERQYGLRSVVLQWFSSYLSGRTFQVVYGGSTSPTVYIPCSVKVKVKGNKVGFLYSAAYTAYHKAQCSVRVCSSCTRRTWKTTSWNTASVSTRLQTTRSYMTTVVVTK